MAVQYVGILDFEANCTENGQLSVQEIIEFPIVPYNLTKQCIEKDKIFHHYCRVEKHPISEFCTQLTGITQEMVDRGRPFREIVRLFHLWMDKHHFRQNILFLTCGDWDLKNCLPQYCDYLNIPFPEEFKSWCNIKLLFRQYYHKRPKGMRSMLDALNLPLEGRHHSGIDDCHNLSKIVDRMVRDGHPIIETSRLA